MAGSTAALSPLVGGLTVVYDPDDAFAAWCRTWLSTQRLQVPVRFIPAGGPEAQARLGVLGTGAELVVLADDGRAWTEAAAFVMCLWATARHRELSRAVRLPLARMGAEAFFHAVTANRAILDRLLRLHPSDDGGSSGTTERRAPAPSNPPAWAAPGAQPQACSR